MSMTDTTEIAPVRPTETTELLPTGDRTPSRYALTDRERRARRPWWLLPLIVAPLVGLVTFAFAESRDHDDAPTTQAAATGPRTGAPEAASRPGTVLVDDQVLPTGAGQLASLAGRTVTAQSVRVLALAGLPAGTEAQDDERFLVGDPAHPALAFLHIDREPTFEIAPGAIVTFTGTVRPIPVDPGALAVTPAVAQGATAEGGYIEISDINAIKPG